MTLNVTAGDADADAFVTVAAFKAYCDAMGRDYSAYDDDTEIEPAIRRGTTFLSTGFTWKGYRTSARAQALAWPRVGATDQEGETVPSDSIPVEIANACCEASWHELTVGALQPTVTLTERVKSERVGSLSVEYADVANTADAARPVLLLLRAMVSGLVATGSSSLVGRAIRG